MLAVASKACHSLYRHLLRLLPGIGPSRACPAKLPVLWPVAARPLPTSPREGPSAVARRGIGGDSGDSLNNFSAKQVKLMLLQAIRQKGQEQVSTGCSTSALREPRVARVRARHLTAPGDFCELLPLNSNFEFMNQSIKSELILYCGIENRNSASLRQCPALKKIISASKMKLLRRRPRPE